jgi:hypothetical protein
MRHATMIEAMDGNEIPITKEQVAELAGEYFRHADLADIPAKLWLDAYGPGRQVYLRAAFDAPVKTISLVRLGALAVGLGDRHGLELVAVAYEGDIDWETIEERNRALNAVE